MTTKFTTDHGSITMSPDGLITGNTYPIKDFIKIQCSGRWQPKQKAWKVNPSEFVKLAQSDNPIGLTIVNGSSTTPKRSKSSAFGKITKPVTKAKVEFPPSVEQMQIGKWLTSTINQKNIGSSLVVEAGAGTGKTSTVNYLCSLLEGMGLSVCYLVFGTKNKLEAEAKLPNWINIQTTHGYGFSVIRKNVDGKVTFNAYKVRNLVFEQLPDKDDNRQEFLQKAWIITPVCKIVSLLKNSFLEPTDENISYLIDFYNVGLDAIEKSDNKQSLLNDLYAMVKLVFKQSHEMVNVIDNDDMLYMPLAYKMNISQYEIVLADEVQDFNRCQISLIEKAYSKHIVWVGDRFQAIFGFRCALPNAMDVIKDETKADELCLSVTYRLPITGVEYVKQCYPHLNVQAADNAKIGTISSIQDDTIDSLEMGTMVICRLNAPMIMAAMSLLAKGIKVSFAKRDISKPIIEMLSSNQADSLTSTLQKVENYAINEVTKLSERGRYMQAAIIEDTLSCVMAISQGCNTYREVMNKIDTLFSNVDSENSIKFSTVHGAKGLEANTVAILHPHLIPHKMAKSDFEQDQEMHIHYVAITRHKEHLILINEKVTE